LKLLGYEWLKFVQKKSVLLLIPILLLANDLIYVKEQQRANAFLIAHIDEYRTFEEAFRQMPFDQGYERIVRLRDDLIAFSVMLHELRDPGNGMLRQQLEQLKLTRPDLAESYNRSPYAGNEELLGRNLQFAKIVLAQYEAIRDHREFVGGMRDRADAMLSVSIFQDPASFSHRNILKTVADFERLKAIPLKIGLADGVVSATRFRATDIFMTVVLFLLCVGLFQHEKEFGLQRLIRAAPKGRLHTAAAKLAVLAILAAALSLIFYGSVLWLAHHLYGFGDLSRYIQSMAAFRRSDLPLTVGQYLGLFLLSKTAVCVATVLLFSVFFVLFDHMGKIGVALGAFLGISCLAFLSIHPLSPLNVLKYVNLFAYFDTYALLGVYQNINFFGFPVRHLRAAVISGLFLLAVLPAAAAVLYVLKNPVDPGFRRNSRWIRYREKIRLPAGTTSIYAHELYKMLFSAKGWLAILVALLIGYQTVRFEEVRFDTDDNYYHQYMRRLSGELTGEKIRFIEEEKSRFDQLSLMYAEAERSFAEERITAEQYNERIAELEALAAGQKAFARLYEQYLHLLELEQSRGIRGHLVNEITSDYLFDNPVRDMWNGMFYMILLLLCLHPLFSIDEKTGMSTVLRCTRNGRFALFAAKHAAGYMAALLLMLLLYAPVYWNVWRWYNPLDWHAPVQSVLLFRNVDFPVTIAGFVALTNALQLAGALVITHVALSLSLLAKKPSLSMLTAAVALVCPLLIQLTGAGFVRVYSFHNALLLFRQFAENGSWRDAELYYGALFAVGGGMSYVAWKRYNRLPIMARPARIGGTVDGVRHRMRDGREHG
jgi:hypothetical protein